MKIILIILSVLLVLGGILSSTFMTGCRSDYAIIMRTCGDIQVLTQAIAQYQKETGELPKVLNDLVGKQLKMLKPDPWGNNYIYMPDNDSQRRVFSLGADAKVGGEGLSTDIYFDTDYKKLVDSI